MRQREYISPSQLKKFEDPDKYYLEYLSDNRPERSPQNLAMAVGSAFDAFVKNHLHERIFGKGANPDYELTTIFEKQVEPQVRDAAWTAGHHVFSEYVACGALADLIIELGESATAPVFEIEVRGAVGATAIRGGVPLLGKPDLSFVNKQGCTVVHDWKVNGYAAKPGANKSPMPGYKMCRECESPFKRVMHKDFQPFMFRGMVINGASYLEDNDPDWAVQVATYSWLFGESVGTETIASIDQIVAKVPTGGGLPVLRVASHRTRVSEAFQRQTMARYQDLWNRIQSGHFFPELSKEDSDAKCAALDEMSKAMYGPEATDDNKWLAGINKKLW